MIGITFEVYQDTLIALRVFFFFAKTQKDKIKTPKNNKKELTKRDKGCII